MKKTTKSTMENLALLSQVGIMMVVPIGFGVYAGNYLDNRFGTTPIWLIVMIILGVGASFRNLMKLTTYKSKEYKNDYTARTLAENFAKEKKNEAEEKANSGSESDNTSDLDEEIDFDALVEEELERDKEALSKLKE